MLVHNKTIQQRAARFHFVLVLILEWWPSLLLGLSGLLSIFISTFPNASFYLAFGGGFDIPIRYLFCAMAVIFTLVGGWGMVKNRRTLTRAEEKLVQVEQTLKQNEAVIQQYFDDVEEVLRFVLLQLATDCNLVERERCISQIRITLYCHDSKNHRFVPVARIAGNPTFEKKGRSSYPDNQGVISCAWQNRVAKFQSDAKNSEEWIEQMVDEYDFDREIAENLKMQPKSMLAIRVEHHGKQVGVTVIESTNKTGKCSAAGSLQKLILDGAWYDPVASLVNALRSSHVARISSAKTT